MIPLCEPVLDGQEWHYIKQCLDTNWVSSVGRFVTLFEERFAETLQCDHAIVTSNGTTALQLALKLLHLSKGDEVLVPSMTFCASVNPILYEGLTPVFVDIDRDTWVMDANAIEPLITKRTKVIMPVHLYGSMVDMEKIRSLATQYGLFVIEDATEALGSAMEIDGVWRQAGTIGDLGAFSFNGNKLITTGAGGMVVTNNEIFAQQGKYQSNQSKTVLANGGMWHQDVGYNFRMPNVLAAMGVAQLETIQQKINAKRQNAQYYNERLQNNPNIQLLSQYPNANVVPWLYSLLVSSEEKRDEAIAYLKEHQIASRPFFSCLHEMPPYQKYPKGSLTVSKEISRRGLHLPSSVNLTIPQMEEVVKRLEEVIL